MIKLFWLMGLILSSGLVKAEVKPVSSDSFNYHARLKLDAGGPFFQFPIPIALYQGVEQEDLSDLRIFNAQGEAVPYAISYPAVQSYSSAEWKAVPFFPLREAARKNARDETPLAVNVQRNERGILVKVQQEVATGNEPVIVAGIIMDVSQLEGEVRALHLDIGPTTFPFHNFTVESSDDLQQWNVLKNDAQFVRLEHSGQRIEKNDVEWNTPTGKYVRLVWQDPKQAPDIHAVSVKVTRTATYQNTFMWSEPIKAFRQQNNTYDYLLPGRMPLEKLDIQLPQTNTLTSLRIQKYMGEHEFAHHSQYRRDDWLTIAEATVFRLKFPQGEVQSSELPLYQPAINQLRLIDTHHTLSHTPPAIRVGLVPPLILFLASGKGPFTLAWGASDTKSEAFSEELFLTHFGTHQFSQASLMAALPAVMTSSHAISSEQDQQPMNHSKWILWGVLMIGVLVLMGMAWKLLTSLKSK